MLRLHTILLFGTIGLQLPARPQNQPRAAPTRAEIIRAATAIIAKAHYAALVTIGEKGQPQARPVDPFAPEKDLTIWIATKATTRKVDQISADPRVTLMYFDPANPGYVTIIGTAKVVRDPAEKAKHWKEEWTAFYKNKNRGDDYLLIRVTPTHLEMVSTADGLMNDPKNWRPIMLELR